VLCTISRTRSKASASSAALFIALPSESAEPRRMAAGPDRLDAGTDDLPVCRPPPSLAEPP
jgi:hypothetical protein